MLLCHGGQSVLKVDGRDDQTNKLPWAMHIHLLCYTIANAVNRDGLQGNANEATCRLRPKISHRKRRSGVASFTTVCIEIVSMRPQ